MKFLGENKTVESSFDVDCEYEWFPCSLTCGGVGLRSVYIITKPRGRGRSCPTEVQCYSSPCPVDCSYQWSEWSTCSEPCNGGVTRRQANISTRPENGGEECPGDQEFPCNMGISCNKVRKLILQYCSIL